MDRSKKMKKYISILVTLFTFTISYGQNEAQIWYFGNGAGLDFNNGCVPTVLTDGAIDGYEGCATISDKLTGQLLFYTNSANVWNRNHSIMPNGNLINGGNTISQVIIIQKPGFDNIYYIITSEVQSFSGQGYRFHQVDMTLNGGLGGLTFKDSLLYSSPVTEKITAIKDANGSDIWLIGHEYNSNKFLSFKVKSSGINTTPIISPIGKIHFDNMTFDAIGEMKASPNGGKLSVVTFNSPHIELFDFNNSTGQVSNLVTIPEIGGSDSLGNACGLYGLSFSSDNSKLYVSQWQSINAGVSAKIIQFDISSNDSLNIINSRVNVYSTTSKNLYSLKLAPNEKIYVGQNLSNEYLGVINSPNVSGLGCNYIDDGLYLNGKYSSWGLNNLMEYNIYCNSVSIKEYSKINIAKIHPNPFSSWTTLNSTDQLINATLTIKNSLGQTVKEIKYINGNTLTFSRDNLLSGLYFINLTQDNCILFTEKIVIGLN